MNHYRPEKFEELTIVSAAQVIACPACNTGFAFHRHSTPHIDACGFESYSLECEKCGAAFAGIVDPLDDTLLLSEMVV
jgi:uncharacterized protein YbaR (Trm112 family)